MRKKGFTLIEILVVVAIIAILAGILVPMGTRAMRSARIRRAEMEMQSIRTAVLQFQSEHRYMPWPNQGTANKPVWLGKDVSTVNGGQLDVIEMLTGSNALKKVYLEVPESARNADDEFVDPWGLPYLIAMDRNVSDTITVSEGPFASAGTITAKVAVASYGPDKTVDTKDDLKTW